MTKSSTAAPEAKGAKGGKKKAAPAVPKGKGTVGTPGASVSKELARRAYRSMLEARLLEEKLAALYRSGKIVGGVFWDAARRLLVWLSVSICAAVMYTPH